MTDLPRVLIEASPCPDCIDDHDRVCCGSCHGTGYIIPTTVSSPVRYEPGTQIELAVRVPIDPDDPDIDEWGSAAWTKRVVAVATVDACTESALSEMTGQPRFDGYALSVSAVRPPTPEETT
jgi:hypothetical protein